MTSFGLTFKLKLCIDDFFGFGQSNQSPKSFAFDIDKDKPIILIGIFNNDIIYFCLDIIISYIEPLKYLLFIPIKCKL